jgi:hypothetical protein
MAILAGQNVENSPSNSNLSKGHTNDGSSGDIFFLTASHYFTKSGIEFWDDFEITNEWHTISRQGTNDYQASVVYSNYFVKIIFEDRTNKVQLSSTLLPLEKVPMRTIPHVNQIIISAPNTNTFPWLMYLYGVDPTNHFLYGN